MFRKGMYLDAAGGAGGGAGVTGLEDLPAPPRIELNADAADTFRGIGEWQGQLQSRVNELLKRQREGRVVTADDWAGFEKSMRELGEKLSAVDSIVRATKGAPFGGAGSDELIIERANMRIRRGDKNDQRDDLPQMARSYHNVMALRTDELVGLASLGRKASKDARLAAYTGNPGLARSAALFERIQRANDRMLMRDWLRSMVDSNYERLGTPEQRMRAMPEWAQYEKDWAEVQRALGETPGSAGGFIVPVILSSQVGDMVEMQYRVAALFGRITMTSKTHEWSFKRTHSTARHILDNDPTDDDPNANNVAASQMSFGKPVWIAQRLADLIFVADDLDEDGVESAVDLAFEDIAIVLGQAVEEGINNGQYNAATMDGSTFNPAGGNRRWCNGLRYHALMTASYPALQSAGGALTFVHGLTVLGKMGAWGAGAPVQDTVWIADPVVAWRNLFLVNAGDTRYFEALRGGESALVQGQVGTFLGRPVVLSPTIPLTHTDGKVNATPANNVKGSLECVNVRRYKIGDRRGIQIDESGHVAYRKFQKAVRGSIRVDFESLDSNGSRELETGATPVGLIYNLS